MTLKETLQKDWIQAMKDKNKDLSNILSQAKAAVLQVEKTQMSPATDEDVLTVLAREVKQRREALPEFIRGGRQDLVDKANFEIETLLKYLPQQMTPEEITALIQQEAEKLGANNMKDMGRLMGALRPLTQGRADGRKVNELVKEFLSN
ncbi:Transamidase GatB domain protein [Clostridiaceae bacterium JG1575]|nr:Transamidase GatB domain protein [Clostridiaceae bacterium JG1575]